LKIWEKLGNLGKIGNLEKNFKSRGKHFIFLTLVHLQKESATHLPPPLLFFEM
jgi:hypothetical protein